MAIPSSDKIAGDSGHVTDHNAIAQALAGAQAQGCVTVAASGVADSIKDCADYVADGTADQVQINSAISDAFASNGAAARSEVRLIGGRFYISDSIDMMALVTLAGAGLGTSITAVGMGAVGMIVLAGKNHHMTTVRDLTLWGNYGAGGSSHGIHYVQSDGGGDGATGTYFPGNSPDASHRFLNLYMKGFTTGTRHGLWMGDNVRDPNAHLVRIFDCSGDGVRLDGSSDGKYTQVITSACDVGFRVGGGSNQFTQCKTAYSVSDGWVVSSSRAHLTGCHSQDSGGHGYNVSGADPTMTSCVADSNSRLSTTAYALHLTSDRAVIDGFHAYDRGQTPGSPQNRGVDFNTASDTLFTGSVRLASGSAYYAGTPDGFVRMVRVGSTVLSVG